MISARALKARPSPSSRPLARPASRPIYHDKITHILVNCPRISPMMTRTLVLSRPQPRTSFFGSPRFRQQIMKKVDMYLQPATKGNTFFWSSKEKQVETQASEELLPDAPAPPRPPIETDLEIDPNSPELKFFKYFIPCPFCLA